ncbi:beta-3-deoxy-D-manno-oct-2-ulosonic acid transferase [Rossellomorea marisflavi]|uniref:capsular polysaccharide export protein, LipB/KpsS family n=1 Tax=Rossellomorea marisflavi TaxID=189381 RepID=UPI0006F5D4CC|nr:beta-3-deoxy-D-manno-oct-2-ulosonic acid transferase [Rossellomorea marisflavi]KQU58366.1 hypothetical protein ASG66_15130 [Bacillus sp. Leaf406]MBV6685738.1 beta-3-deoxy-D-manno-oct-2-ulosonic acid transferase [Bacillus sp. JRC01]MDW4528392.1 beta-3-deoxy-D-manno-oct-2-ulosonic acid transferase [Rossellomorea marisflavi]
MKMVKKIVNVALQYVRFFVKIMFINSHRGNSKPIALVFRVSKWKQGAIEALLDEYTCLFIPKYINPKILTIISLWVNQYVIITWGYDDKSDKYFSKHSNVKKVPFYRLEDGFVRSVGLGAMLTPPYSICLDKRGMYFDSTKESDLEYLLNTFPFGEHPDLEKRANKVIHMLQMLKLSKYNHLPSSNISNIYGPKKLRRVLVVGQVEDDASIRKGSRIRYSNNDLVRIAVKENPDCEVFYKPHPDVLSGRRKMKSNPEDVRDIVQVIDSPVGLADALNTVDHVYTITSLSGFEALIRGIKVTTLGAPFYSGWGLTDDRQNVDRRKRMLTKEQLLIGAYILYPRYADPLTMERLSLEETIQRINKSRNKSEE